MLMKKVIWNTEKIQNEVFDLEDMNKGINVIDLRLDEYRQELLRFYKDHSKMEKLPHDLHFIVKVTENLPARYIFVVKPSPLM